jgi:hypothetical protein
MSNFMKRSRRGGRSVCFGALALAALAACRRTATETTAAIEKVRDVEGQQAGFAWGVAAKDRFGLGASAGASHGQSGGAASSAGKWVTPPGWTEVAPTTLRLGNWRVGSAETDGGVAECYLTFLGGDGGGLAANVNRWRTQMGLGPLTMADIDACEKLDFLGAPSPMVVFEGQFTGMDSSNAKGGYQLAGVLRIEPSGSAFLKFVGPTAVVKRELDAFRTLARSIGKGSDVESSSDAPTSNTAASRTAESPFTWTVPKSWTRAPDKPGRAVSFYVDADRKHECYVTVLAGEAGGALANVNRWRGQISRPPLEPAELEALDVVPMLGGMALWVEFDGQGGDGAPARLLGAIHTTPEESVFVKLIAPPETAADQRSAVLEFCASLRKETP